MKMLKYFKTIGLILLIILLLSFIITLFHYFDLFSLGTIKTIKLIGVIVSMFIGGIYIGGRSSKKGYLEGIKVAAAIVLMILLFTLISKNFEIKAIVYYLILFVSSTVGAMIGIQKKKDA